jgi:hypothetical protein
MDVSLERAGVRVDVLTLAWSANARSVVRRSIGWGGDFVSLTRSEVFRLTLARVGLTNWRHCSTPMHHRRRLCR